MLSAANVATVGTMAPGSTIYDTPAIINAAFNAQMKLVRGFEGVANIVNAAEALVRLSQR